MNTVIKDEPTQEQLKRFWEWCGFVYRECNPNFPQLKSSPYGMAWFHLNDKDIGFNTLPPIDLNNLFKYAVPNLEYVDISWQHGIKTNSTAFIRTLAGIPVKNVVGGREIYQSHKTPALALFWAIYQVIENKE